jgi:hypothetical protein
MRFLFLQQTCLPARRSSARSAWVKFAASIAAWIFLSLGISGCGQGSFADHEPLPVESYLAKPGDFLGNRYLLRAQIDEQIRWEKGLGRLLAVQVEGSEKRLPVFVPEGVGESLHVGQRYAMKALIDQGGVIYVEELRKY